MNLKRILIVFSAWLVSGSFTGHPIRDYNPDAWIEDFTQLKQALSAHYSNLEWAIENRKLDLKQLSDHTVTQLTKATTDAEAKKIIESFLNAFGDGHLFVQWPQKETTGSPSSETTPVIPPSLCERLRFSAQNQASRIDPLLIDNYTEIKNDDSKYFSIGVLRPPTKNNIGILRIPLFSEYAFPDLCELVTAEMKLSKEASCDEDCEDRVGRKAADLLTAALARQINVLKQSGITTLVVDITGNGGGTNWAEPAARTLTTKALKTPRQQFIRHPHWTKQFERRLDIIKADKKNQKVGNDEGLQQAENILRMALSESQKPCDRSGLWKNRKPDCSLVVQRPVLYPQSVQAYSKPGSLPEAASSQFIFFPSRYAYKEGVYSGKLIVLVDRNTWSSAEYFAAMLRDNDAAILMGEPTGGAGCGYTNGGIPTVLKNSKAKVKVPDCVRLRADGSNEVAGITPDVLVPWRPNDNKFQRTKRVAEALIHYSRTK